VTPRLLPVEAAATQLAVSPNTVYRLIARGALRAVDVDASGRKPRLRVREDDLGRFINSRTSGSAVRAAS